MKSDFLDRIFSVTPAKFEELTLDVFRFQAKHSSVYAQYISHLNVDVNSIKSIEQIPFLPISLFRSHRVLVDNDKYEVVFSSSGTTGAESSKHYVKSLAVYEQSFLEGFRIFYGDVSEYCILALLPSYLEREGSSLVYMANRLIADSQNPQSGFFLHNPNELIEQLEQLEANRQPTILLGVTFALLELASKHNLKLKSTIVMETGGMKGRGKELIRSEVHTILKQSLGLSSVHSEYGMTELLSQAYSKGEGVFFTPPWMRIRVRDPYDPFSYLPNERSGALNIIDLANINSCSFVQTDDLGVLHVNGSFEVSGRMDGSQIRGCNLLVL
ncbi:MAG: acyltransferase [Bacteroidales bacterium]|nr:acyltransferase [Bacteroidales bacterium]MDD4384127.1 acyltransferase [Bacteroidales bacterium]MDY0197181.1 acyltransferase [Tenuifilaceae bacterium]